MKNIAFKRSINIICDILKQNKIRPHGKTSKIYGNVLRNI